MRISVVIPVYNEEKLLARCLDALLDQTRSIDEIIVVDNNSRDKSAAIARGYKKVQVISEKRQGTTYARTTGFDAATGHIIGRIDADTIVTPNWAATIETTFLREPELAAIGGDGAIAEFSPPGKFWFGLYFTLYRRFNERYIGISPIIYGFNGAFRQSAWKKIRPLVSFDDTTINEDIDMTICLHKNNLKVGYMPDMKVKMHHFRQWKPSKIKFYYQQTRRTLTKHQYGNPKLFYKD